MTKDEEAVWAYIVAHPDATITEIAENCNVPASFVERLIDKSGTPDAVWREGIKKEKAPKLPKSRRTVVLDEASRLTAKDREADYGVPYDNFTNVAGLWEGYLNSKPACLPMNSEDDYSVRITAEDVAWLMVLLKMARTFGSRSHADNYVDAAGYAALAGECREIEDGET